MRRILDRLLLSSALLCGAIGAAILLWPHSQIVHAQNRPGQFSALTVTGAITAGSGAVGLTDGTGKIPAIDTTHFASLSGANLTTLNASNLSSGTVATARLGTGVASALTVLLGNNTWGAAPGVLTLLGQSSGTNTNAAAANVYTLPITGLTAVDQLLVVLTVSSTTQQTSTVAIYNVTDSVTLQDLGTAAAGGYYKSALWSGPDQSATTQVLTAGTLGGTTNSVLGTIVAFTTAWTGSWTFALRHGGVTAGGTFHYTINVYKVAGQ